MLLVLNLAFMNIQIIKNFDGLHPSPAADLVHRDILQSMKRSIVRAASRAGEGHVPRSAINANRGVSSGSKVNRFTI
jgi:hypothetical protein